MNSNLLTMKEFRTSFGSPTNNTVFKWLRLGLIKKVKVGNRLFIDLDSLPGKTGDQIVIRRFHTGVTKTW